MVSHMTHMRHVEPISFNTTMLKSFGGGSPPPPETTFIDEPAALLQELTKISIS